MTKSLHSSKVVGNQEKETVEKEEYAQTEVTESDRWWDCRMEVFAEWTFEGSLKWNLRSGHTKVSQTE